MKKLYDYSYFNKQNWILEYFDKLNLSLEEAFLLLLIQYAHDNGLNDSLEFLSSKMNLKPNELDPILTGLVNKNYITLNNGGYSFNINNIFEFDPSKYEVINNTSVFSIFEEFLNRTLSGDELNKISNIVNQYGEDETIDALRKAEAHNKRSISYVESILLNDSKSFKNN